VAQAQQAGSYHHGRIGGSAQHLIGGNEMKSIPTKYAGVQFRSRLEAKWAALFDIAGMQWSYEPFDLEGWAPDFAIHTKRGDILVEVKPVNLVPCFVFENGFTLPDSATFEKAKKHWQDNWVLLVGERPQSNADHFGIGSLLDTPSHARGKVKWNDMLDSVCVRDCEAKWRAAGNATQWVPA
jgi:hypothetical protein